ILPFSISTAAGESTLPVRGSSRRRALTRAAGAGGEAVLCTGEQKPNTAAVTSGTTVRFVVRRRPPVLMTRSRRSPETACCVRDRLEHAGQDRAAERGDQEGVRCDGRLPRTIGGETLHAVGEERRG